MATQEVIIGEGNYQEEIQVAWPERLKQIDGYDVWEAKQAKIPGRWEVDGKLPRRFTEKFARNIIPVRPLSGASELFHRLTEKDGHGVSRELIEEYRLGLDSSNVRPVLVPLQNYEGERRWIYGPLIPADVLKPIDRLYIELEEAKGRRNSMRADALQMAIFAVTEEEVEKVEF
jgi:hypothetical protein